MSNNFVLPTPPLPLTPAEEEKLRGRLTGFKTGYDEGYLRGRLAILSGRPEEPLPVRDIHVMYVASGKGYPYSPLDEAVVAALQKLTSRVTVTDVRQNLVELAGANHPDLVIVLDGMDLPLEQINVLRGSGIRTAIWLTDDPYYTDFTLKIVLHYDYVFTLERNCIDFYKGLGCQQVHYLPFGFHREHYHPTTTRSPIQRDISFIGSAYWNRINFFREVLPELMQYNTVINGIWWDRLPEAPQYGERIEIGKWMSPQETALAYSGSKIVINLHRSHIDEDVNNNSLGITAVSPNPRTFEIAASGTLQLCDARDDMGNFYKPGEEIETFASPKEMMDKIRFYLTHEEERREIVLRAYERTLKDHTYTKRLNQLLTIIYG
ncbi:spore maturation protein cgeB [Bacillus sp. FJAT-27264]|uniref:CgeB family protein n=1 Tax=Paenibacillus sp. (strain DSM 101736 / FJAT-27264) TaxID=1850362 RepID=UPI000808082F|nr:glycosyltransferase [Bacillus sp. FJAT-27264]OBZ09710.1 spore maturation protein cgeB [Bacillus sp. FJAT-27264]